MFLVPAIAYILVAPIGVEILKKRDVGPLAGAYIIIFYFLGWAGICWWTLGKWIFHS